MRRRSQAYKEMRQNILSRGTANIKTEACHAGKSEVSPESLEYIVSNQVRLKRREGPDHRGLFGFGD